MILVPLDTSVGLLTGDCLNYVARGAVAFKQGNVDNAPFNRTLNSILLGTDFLQLKLMHDFSCHKDGKSSAKRPAFRIDYKSK